MVQCLGDASNPDHNHRLDSKMFTHIKGSLARKKATQLSLSLVPFLLCSDMYGKTQATDHDGVGSAYHAAAHCLLLRMRRCPLLLLSECSPPLP